MKIDDKTWRKFKRACNDSGASTDREWFDREGEMRRLEHHIGYLLGNRPKANAEPEPK